MSKLLYAASGKKLVVTLCHESTLSPMGRAFGLVAVTIVVGIGGYIYMNQATQITPDGRAPKTTITVTGVQNDLLAMANAERRYFVTNSKYASLAELRSNGDIQVPTRPDYTYSADAGDNSFRIVATYSGADPHAPRHIAVDQNLTITTN
jgi:hypothetical protein